VLADQAIRRRTEQLAETMRGYRGAAGAAEALERLVDAGA
jgi:UDP:flavonoid glycosyltransferase YjiC (YdhE family)